MKKINEKPSQKDRFICVTEQGTHKFCCKSDNRKECRLLFANDLSPFVLNYFKK